MVFRRLALVFLLVAVGFVSTACGDAYVQDDDLYADDPGFRIAEDAEIRDTTANREVLDILAQYRQAVVKKDFGALKRLVAAGYYDNAGTTDTTEDDYDAQELSTLYEMMARHAQSIKYNVLVKDLEVDQNRAWVDYEYEYAYEYDVGDDVAWDAGVDVNRLELESQDGRWRIVSGL